MTLNELLKAEPAEFTEEMKAELVEAHAELHERFKTASRAERAGVIELHGRVAVRLLAVGQKHAMRDGLDEGMDAEIVELSETGAGVADIISELRELQRLATMNGINPEIQEQYNETARQAEGMGVMLNWMGPLDGDRSVFYQTRVVALADEARAAGGLPPQYPAEMPGIKKLFGDITSYGEDDAGDFYVEGKVSNLEVKDMFGTRMTLEALEAEIDNVPGRPVCYMHIYNNIAQMLGRIMKVWIEPGFFCAKLLIVNELAIMLIKKKVLRGLSPGFGNWETKPNGDITKCKIFEISIVPDPAGEGTNIEAAYEATRSATATDDKNHLQPREDKSMEEKDRTEALGALEKLKRFFGGGKKLEAQARNAEADTEAAEETETPAEKNEAAADSGGDEQARVATAEYKEPTTKEEMASQINYAVDRALDEKLKTLRDTIKREITETMVTEIVTKVEEAVKTWTAKQGATETQARTAAIDMFRDEIKSQLVPSLSIIAGFAERMDKIEGTETQARAASAVGVPDPVKPPGNPTEYSGLPGCEG